MKCYCFKELFSVWIYLKWLVHPKMVIIYSPLCCAKAVCPSFFFRPRRDCDFCKWPVHSLQIIAVHGYQQLFKKRLKSATDATSSLPYNPSLLRKYDTVWNETNRNVTLSKEYPYLTVGLWHQETIRTVVHSDTQVV